MDKKIFDLKTEYRINPIGISTATPRFSWKYSATDNSIRQASYRIIVKKLKPNGDIVEEVWDSGIINSDKQFAIYYDGKPLSILTKYSVFVSIVDSEGENINSDIAYFETGLFSLNDWCGKFATASGEKHCIHLRSNFTVKNKKVISGRFYSASTAGAFDNVSLCMNNVYLTLNGNKLGNDAIMPGQTSIKKGRAVYRVFDILDRLYNGANAFGAVIVSIGFSAFVLLDYEDGEREIIDLSKSFKANGNGPYHLWDKGVGEQGGKLEDYDKTEEYAGFDTPTYDDSDWKTPKYTDFVKSLEQQVTTVERREEISPISIDTRWENHYVVDFGKVLHGHIKLTIKNPKKVSRVSVNYAEGLFDNGEINPYSTINMHHGEKGPHSDTYVSIGETDEEVFEPRFSNHSFRYVDIYNYPAPLKKEDVVAVFVNSPVENGSCFSCSDEEINKLFGISYQSERCNLVGIQTDCASRERIGWLGDAWVCGEAEMLNFELLNFMEYWCHTIKDEQEEDGFLPYICPAPYPRDLTDIPWSTACILLPWFTYLRNGDDKILKDMFGVMTKWVDFILPMFDGDYRLNYYSVLWGDHTAKIGIDKNLLGGLYLLFSAKILSEICDVLGVNKDKYVELENNLKKSLVKEYFINNKFELNSQGSISHALNLGLFSGKEYDKLFNDLLQDIKKNNNLMTTGALSIYHMIELLLNENRNDVICDICKAKEEGSFLSWIYNHDATTSFEFLTFYDSASRNHPFLMGSVTKWFYVGIAGIKQKEAGYKTFELSPFFNDTITSSKAVIPTLYGDIKVESKKEKGYSFNISVPFGTTCELIIPKDAVFTPSIDTRFCYKTEKDRIVLFGGDYLIDIKNK